jgi:hypothetical protein
MIILNYFFIGVLFTFIIESLFYRLYEHPLLKDTHEWGWSERIILILIWPLGLLVFLGAFIKNYKK